MSQLIDNLNIIESVKTDIKAAIENKGVDMTGVSFPGYASKIGEITTSFVTVPLSVSANGTYTPGEGIDGYSQVNVNVPAPQFVTETLNVSANGTYTPGQGIDGYSQVVVDVPQSVTGYTEKDLTEKTINITNLNNSASFVASEAFSNNTTIQTVNLPYATTIGDSAFYNCSSLSKVSLPVCSYIGREVFRECKSLLQVSLPVCSYIGREVFRGCKSLLQVSLPVCSYINTGGLSACYSLSQVNLPVCSYIGNWVFGDCHSLSQVSLPVCSCISNYAFWGCSSLSIITIGYSGVCSLNNSDTFTNTQITSSTGSIYVPASLVDSYKSANNWSYFSTRIFPIE